MVVFHRPPAAAVSVAVAMIPSCDLAGQQAAVWFDKKLPNP